MNPRLVKIDRSRIVVDPGSVLSLLGTTVDEDYILELAREYIGKCQEHAQPCGGYVLAKAGEMDSKDAISVNGTRLVTGKVVRGLLGNADEIAFFIASAGSGPENLSRQLIGEGKYLEGYLADLVGSGIVESVADQVHRQLMDYAAGKGKKCTNRYSPGYCSWNVEEQQKLFSFFGKGICGVTLNDSSLMSPIKSVSGAIGIGPEVEFRTNTCEICSRKECHFRMTGQ